LIHGQHPATLVVVLGGPIL